MLVTMCILRGVILDQLGHTANIKNGSQGNKSTESDTQ